MYPVALHLVLNVHYSHDFPPFSCQNVMLSRCHVLMFSCSHVLVGYCFCWFVIKPLLLGIALCFWFPANPLDFWCKWITELHPDLPHSSAFGSFLCISTTLLPPADVWRVSDKHLRTPTLKIWMEPEIVSADNYSRPVAVWIVSKTEKDSEKRKTIFFNLEWNRYIGDGFDLFKS